VPGQRVRLVTAAGDGLTVGLGKEQKAVTRSVARSVFVSRRIPPPDGR